MSQDVNRVIDNLSKEIAQKSIQIALLQEENERLKAGEADENRSEE